jgi:hypothetical protein
MTSEEKLKRFDDVYKLALTLVAIKLTFGSIFLIELGFTLFLATVLGISVTWAIWSWGHLTEDIQFEASTKLIGWWALTTFLPGILLNFPGKLTEVFPPHLALLILASGLYVYRLGFRHLKVFLPVHRARSLWLGPLISTIILAIINLTLWAF